MNILFDIGHPAHVHLFKHVSWNLQNIGHNVFFTVRSGEKEAELLKEYGFAFKILGRKRKSLIGKILGIFVFSLKILQYSSRKKADLYISHGSMFAGYAAFLRHKPHIALEDSGNMEQLRFSIPVSSVILSPDILDFDLGKKQISYKGFHELAYLSPKYFCPNSKIKTQLGIVENDAYCILRFSAWGASHDFKQSGLGELDKKNIIEYLSKRFKIFISSEKPLPEEYRLYEFNLPANKLHEVIAEAEIVISEGATIASEAGVLGVPSIYINSIERCYNENLAKYGLVHNFRSPDGVLEKIKEILSVKQYKKVYNNRRNVMLKDKIDITAMLTWFIDNYPESAEKMRLDPNYQNRFSNDTPSSNP